MYKAVSDESLVKEISKGNQEAFQALISRYEQKAYHLALRYTRNLQDAEEVLQDAFTVVYRKARSFEGKSTFSSWFYRVTVNAALMKIRKRRQQKYSLLEDDPASKSVLLHSSNSDQIEVDQRVYLEQVRHALERAISDLPEEYRPVLILRDVDGLSSREVAKILNLSVPAIKSRLHRARLMLRKTLADFYREHNSEQETKIASAM